MYNPHNPHTYIHIHTYIYKYIYIYTHTHKHTHTYIYIYYISSSYRAGSTDIPDPLSPLLPIVHHPR